VVSPTALVEEIEHFRRRLLVDCLLEATANYWRRRADDFRSVGTPECDEVAQACEHRARVSQLGGDIQEYYQLLDDALDAEVAS
jgi:hypothetical protein